MTELTAAHIRAAKALLEWTQPELAAAAKLSVPTVRRMEGPRGPAASTLQCGCRQASARRRRGCISRRWSECFGWRRGAA